MNKQTIINLIFFIFIVLSCEKSDIAKDTPDCIRTKIVAIQEEEVRNPPAEVWKYDYRGMEVYYFTAYCCDIPAELYDKDCNFICQPDGGITGCGDGQCADFASERTNGSLIWKDSR
jgi:hypothetical protein